MSILDQCVKRQLALECSEISLKRTGIPALSIKGPGTIWTDQCGVICFKFSASPEQYAPYMRTRLERPRPVPDSPTDEDYHDFVGTTVSGEKLSGRLLFPEVDNDSPDGLWTGPGTVSGKIYTLTLSENSEDESSWAKFWIPSSVILPSLKPVNESDKGLSFGFGSKRVEIVRREGYTEVFCSLTTEDIVKNGHWRVIEALEFVLGQSIYPAALETLRDHLISRVIVSVISDNEHEAPLPPPLHLSGWAHFRAPNDLFWKYYEYLRSCTDGEYPPDAPLAFSSIRATSDSQPELKALVCSVAAETLIGCCFPEYTKIDGGLKKAVHALAKKIEGDTDLLLALRKRVEGMVRNINNPSNSDGLKTFIFTQASNTSTAQEIFGAWRKLRNPSTHGKRADPDTINEIRRRTRVVLDLCYSLVLARIGYLNRRSIYGHPIGNPWTLTRKKQMRIPSRLTDETATKIVKKEPWVTDGQSWSKRIPFPGRSGLLMVLTVEQRKQSDGSKRFTIRVDPTAVLADAWSCLVVGAEFSGVEDAQIACHEIAKRAVLHSD